MREVVSGIVEIEEQPCTPPCRGIAGRPNNEDGTARGNHRPAAPYYQEEVGELDPARAGEGRPDRNRPRRHAGVSRLATGDRSGSSGGDLRRREVGCAVGALCPFVPMLSPFPSGLAAPAAVSDSQEDRQAGGWLRTKAYDHGLRPLLTEPERTSMDPGGGQARGFQNRMRVRESKSLRSWPRARVLY
jgi:hypothetical protein